MTANAVTRLKRRLRALATRGETMLLTLCSRSDRLASLYYALFSRRFDREHRAMILGRLAYLRAVAQGQGSIPLLRRNIHRLEKGLIMRPRRARFALDYIEETVTIYAKALQSDEARNELIWAHDVLQDYFRACDAPEVQALRASFETLPPPARGSVDAFDHDEPRIPYGVERLAAAPVDYEAFLTLCRRRRSVRWFDGRPVERALVERLVAAARLAPSACNRQPYEFIVFDDPATAAAAARLAGGTGGYADQVPALVVLVGDLGNYFHERDRHLIYIDAALAAMSFMLAAETLGLSSCPINWSDVPEREKAFYDFLPSLPEHKRPIMMLALGYADRTGRIAYSSRKEIEALVRFNPPIGRAG